MSSVHDRGRVDGLGDLSEFRREFYRCLPLRADALFELTDAVLCADGPVSTLVGLSLAVEHRRGHGGLYDGLACGQVETGRLRRTMAGLSLPRDDAGRIVLAVDVSSWLRPDGACCAERLFCPTPAVRGKGKAQMVPGWPYSFVAALETGRTSWTAILDVQRLGPGDDATEVTAAQVRDIVDRLRAAGQWSSGDPEILVVFDAGYDMSRLTFLLADLPVDLLGRVRSDRVFRSHSPVHAPHTGGRPAKHGAKFKLSNPATHPEPTTQTTTDTTHYGTARASAWNRLHPRLTRRAAWKPHEGPLPIIECSIIRLRVDRLPGDRNPTPVWLWYSRPQPLTPAEVDRLWHAFLRRFDLEHTFRFLKQTLGWTRPRFRTPDQGDRWTWLIITAHTQLRLARHLTTDLRRPWEKRVTEPRKLSPARIRRGFRNLRPNTALPASAPKPTHPGPGRPPGTPNTHRATRHNIGKTTTPATTTNNNNPPTG